MAERSIIENVARTISVLDQIKASINEMGSELSDDAPIEQYPSEISLMFSEGTSKAYNEGVEKAMERLDTKADKISMSSSLDKTDPVISLINNHEERFGELSSLTINWFEERPKIYYSLATGEYSETKDEETAGEVYKYISPDGTDIQYLSIGDDIIPTDSEGNYYIKEYENTPLSELNIEDDFITSIIFTSGSTATNLIYPEEILFDGMDCIDNVFTPIPNKRYNVFISYDGQYLIGEVGGVSI
jgi:hypothetical protein